MTFYAVANPAGMVKNFCKINRVVTYPTIGCGSRMTGRLTCSTQPNEITTAIMTGGAITANTSVGECRRFKQSRRRMA